MNSKIIDNKEYNKTLKNWINEKNNIKAKLLYRLSENGAQISEFHKLCDNKGPILILFNVKEGNIKVGIYTSLSFDSTTNDWKHDNETFIFNLNENKKYKKIKQKCSIYCHSNYGPYTYSFGIYKNMNSLYHESKSLNTTYENSKAFLQSNGENRYYDLLEIVNINKNIELY